MILCLLIALLGTSLIVAYVGVMPQGGKAGFSQSPTMTAANSTIWAMGGNTWAGMGNMTLIILLIVGGMILLVVCLLIPKEEEQHSELKKLSAEAFHSEA